MISPVKGSEKNNHKTNKDFPCEVQLLKITKNIYWRDVLNGDSIT